MRITTIFGITIFALFVGTACGGGSKSDKKEEAKAGEGADADAKEADAKGGEEAKEAEAGGGGGGEVALPLAGLKGTAVEGAKVSEMMGNDMVQGPGLVATVEAGDDKPKTGEEAQKEADMYTPKDPKIETLEDGYVLTFTNEGGMGTNYWVQARREIDGKAYWCTTTASQQEQQDNAVAFCKSLTK